MSVDHIQKPEGAPSSAPTRRAITKGALWAMPAAAASYAAPAYAASCSPVSTITEWAGANYKQASSTSGTYTVPDPDGAGRGTGMTVKVSSVFGSNTQAGNQRKTRDDNLRGISTSRGGFSNTLALHQSPIENPLKTGTATLANSQTVTFTFSKPVTGLSFTIADVDSNAYDFVDQVTVSGGIVASSATNSQYVRASGGTATPVNANRPIDDGGTSGNVKFTVSGSVTSITITYYNITSASDPRIDGDQGVFISPLAFTYNPC